MPESNIARYNLAVAFHLNNDIDNAITEFRKAISLDSSFLEPYLNLGSIYYNKGQLKDAQNIFIKAQNVAPDDKRIQKYLEKIDRETTTESDYLMTGSGNFQINYSKQISQPNIDLFKDGLEETYQDLGTKYNFLPKNKQLVILYTRDDFQKGTGSDHWTSGIFDGRLRFRVDEDSVYEKIISVIRHEYTHLIVYTLSEGKCPIWINEGLAGYHQYENIEEQTNYLREIPDDELYNTNELNSYFKNRKISENKIRQAYAQAASIIHSIIDTYGYITVREMLIEISRKPPELVIQETLGTDTDGLIRVWRIRELERYE